MKSELKAVKALELLKPDGGWVIYGDDFDSIVYDEGVSPLTKKQFDDAVKTIEKNELAQAEAKAAQKQAIAERLGLTADELQVLLG